MTDQDSSGTSADRAPTPAQRAQALRIIQALRQGSNCLEGTGLFSAGRKILLRGATDQLEELELSGGAAVRWLRGRYGQGKTHFFARLIEIAHRRNWVTSYVQVSGRGQGPELHRFEEIYAAIVRNCLCRDLVLESDGRVEPGRIPGWEWILERWYEHLRRLAAGAAEGDVPSFRLRDVIEQAIITMRRGWGIVGSFVEALRQFALACADGDVPWSQTLLRWFRGEDAHSLGGDVRARLHRAGVRERISRRNAKEMLRTLSAFIKYQGFGGTLILLDEVENVLQETPSSRRAAYTILRELVDNVDDRHGMMHAAFYVSGTPDLFESEKGITEYEALAARVLLPRPGTPVNPAAPVVDLAAAPLGRDEFLDMAMRIASLYRVASNLDLPRSIEDDLRALLDDALRKDPDMTARGWVRSVVDTLDRLRASRPT